MERRRMIAGDHATGTNLSDLGYGGLLDQAQHAAFHYFQHNFNLTMGMIANTLRFGAPASIAIVGFALALSNRRGTPLDNAPGDRRTRARSIVFCRVAGNGLRLKKR
jgi:hypothetical protein